MIFRLSLKLAKKLKVAPTEAVPLADNPFADWSAHLFTAERTQYMILTNTVSFYSAVMYGRDAVNDSQFLDRAIRCLRETMFDDGQQFIYAHFVAPASATVQFSKALNRSVTGSMNDLIYHAKRWLTEGQLPPEEASHELNEIPLSALEYRNPREAFKSLRPHRGNSALATE